MEIHIKNNSRNIHTVKIGGYENPLFERDVVSLIGIKFMTSLNFKVERSIFLSQVNLLGRLYHQLIELDSGAFAYAANIVYVEKHILFCHSTEISIPVLPNEQLKMIMYHASGRPFGETKTINIEPENRNLILLLI